MKKKTEKMLRSPLTWLGGKSLLRGKIISRLPNGIKTWVEVFCGASWVTFGKIPSPYEVLNDIDSMLVNFYEVVSDDSLCEELIQELEHVLISRELFEKYQKTLKNKGLSPVKKASMFYYVIKNSFGGMGKYFGVDPLNKPGLNVKEVRRLFLETQQRLAWVRIENLDFRECIKRYDRKYTFFYLDPPYHTPTSRSYCSFFIDHDYRDLKCILDHIEGRFLLSINDCPFIRDLFSAYTIEEIETRYSVMSNGNKKVSELLIRNY